MRISDWSSDVCSSDLPEMTLADLDRDAAPIWLVAERLRDPGNLGTMLRTGDAVGAGGLILLDDSTDPYAVEAVRASMGAIFTQKLVVARWEAFLPWLRPDRKSTRRKSSTQ